MTINAMPPRQMTFDLPIAQALRRQDFLTAPSNAQALAVVEAPHSWPTGKMVLIGPPGSGKTHIAHIWATEQRGQIWLAQDLTTAVSKDLPAALVVENADEIAGDPAGEHALFHLHNLQTAAGGRLLITARTAPNRWPITLPDLASRLQALPLATLATPDDALLAGILVKHFADRQLTVPPEVVTYVLRRMERSAHAARDLAARLDAQALTEQRAITRILAAQVLDQAERIPLHSQNSLL